MRPSQATNHFHWPDLLFSAGVEGEVRDSLRRMSQERASLSSLQRAPSHQLPRVSQGQQGQDRTSLSEEKKAVFDDAFSSRVRDSLRLMAQERASRSSQGQQSQDRTSLCQEEHKAIFDDAFSSRALGSFQPRSATASVPHSAPVQRTASMILTRDSIPSLSAIGGGDNSLGCMPRPFSSTNPMHADVRLPQQVGYGPPASSRPFSAHANVTPPPLPRHPSTLTTPTLVQQPRARPPAVTRPSWHIAHQRGQLTLGQQEPHGHVDSQQSTTVNKY